MTSLQHYANFFPVLNHGQRQANYERKRQHCLTAKVTNRRFRNGISLFSTFREAFLYFQEDPLVCLSVMSPCCLVISICFLSFLFEDMIRFWKISEVNCLNTKDSFVIFIFPKFDQQGDCFLLGTFYLKYIAYLENL